MASGFRYLTGGLEIAAAILLVTPGRSGYGALLVACIMLGAVAVHVVVLQNSTLIPLVLFALAGIVFWARLLRKPKAA